MSIKEWKWYLTSDRADTTKCGWQKKSKSQRYMLFALAHALLPVWMLLTVHLFGWGGGTKLLLNKGKISAPPTKVCLLGVIYGSLVWDSTLIFFLGNLAASTWDVCRRVNLYQAFRNTQQWINSPAKPPAGSLLGREVTTLTFSPPWLNVPSEQKYCTGQSQRLCWLHNNYLQCPRRLVGHVWEQI